jgi:hypothetical protein
MCTVNRVLLNADQTVPATSYAEVELIGIQKAIDI